MKLIILDRDGVINQDSDDFIKSPEEFIPLPGSIEAIARLSKAGYTVAVATNQSGIARGYYTLDTLQAMHDKLASMLAKLGGHVDYIAYCPHGPDDNCDCRKPMPGMYHDIASHFNTSLTNVPVIGDSLRDLQAAHTVGATPYLVRTGKGERTIAKGEGLDGVPIYDDLAAVVDELLS
ncbi:MAG: D-glycero-beta-D-manno-heptose 1,7-bisphosphate 7-phosphatase [Gammaproteobacteria bacterium]|jgi:D-glycero-D-manno-heptose 1,7-bisphosphate phosphatase